MGKEKGKKKRGQPKDQSKKASNHLPLKSKAEIPPPKCLLLALPFELRYRIWGLVLGHELIHIEYYGKRRDQHDWRYVICQNDGPEDRPLRKVMGPWGQERILESHHHACHTRKSGYKYEDEKGYVPLQRLQLQVLGVSKQVHEETNQVLYSTNTFGFMDPLPFNYFIMTRTPLQGDMIRKLRLCMNWTDRKEMREWNSALDRGMMALLKGLRSLRLQVVHHMKASDYREAARTSGWPMEWSFCAGLDRLSVLPLVHVEVAIRNSGYPEEGQQWTERGMRDTARRVETALLV
ncbi:MAG: hypothetical protein Q9174_006468 [Haloplaca sp. 1 TL-2023]